MADLEEARKQLELEDAEQQAARDHLARLQAQHVVAQHEVATAADSDLAAAGGVLAGLQAQVERAQGRLAETELAYNARLALIADLQERQERVAEQERVRAAVEGLSAAWNDWQERYLELDAHTRNLWAWFRSLQDAAYRLALQAQEMGIPGPDLLPTAARMRGLILRPSDAVVQASRDGLDWNPDYSTPALPPMPAVSRR